MNAKRFNIVLAPLKFICLASLLFCSHTINSAEIDNDYHQKFAGVEVMGADPETAQKIRQMIPFKQGDFYSKSEIERYLSTCKDLVLEKFMRNVSCSSISYGNGDVYLNVDILQIENKPIYRTIPIKEAKVERLPKELENLYDALTKRFEFLIAKGNFPREIEDQNYKDYEDPELHEIAVKLSKVTPEYDDILLDIVHYSQDNNERSKAADLFSWSRNDKNLITILEWDILFDPDEYVRNNMARSFLPILTNLKDKKLLENLILAYCKQASFPSHSDRNKALYSLLYILEKNKDLASSINGQCFDTISYINEMSILKNSQGVAKKILDTISES